MPLATMPWWKSLAMMNENKGVFGLNMLNWWDARGASTACSSRSRDGLDAGELEPVVAEAFPFERAAEAHRYIAERRTSARSC